MFTIRKLGEFGAVETTLTTPQTGTWFAFTALSTTVFATLVDVSVVRDGTTASVVYSAGTTIFGAFTNFTLTNGSVRFYNTRKP